MTAIKQVGFWAWPWDTSRMGAFEEYFLSMYRGLRLPQSDSDYQGSCAQREFVTRLESVEKRLLAQYEAAWAEYKVWLDDFSTRPVHERRQNTRKFDYDAQPVVEWKGYSPCRICELANGSVSYRLQIGDITFTWPEGYIHYIRDHGVRPDPDFERAINEHYEKLP
jgi:hypothetical protein